ncbi:MAG: glycosyltransferase family 39 protein [Bacteroidota bacterium]|nr:glycosyltransferase family 39 protein [Bacteroidota bacterium]
MKTLKKYWDEKPLLLIMGAAILFRLISVIFARGWGMIDDHFLVIESSQSWVDGTDYNSWLPGSAGNTGPTGHNFFYPGVHFLLFSFFKLIGLGDPQVKMLIVRAIHAAWSLITVFFGYKIAERIGNEKSARLVGLLLAILWFMPWVSVRNLVEVACIPLLILAVWFMISRSEPKGQFSAFFLAGLFLGLAFDVRYQTAWFAVGSGIALLLMKRWRETIALVLGALLPIVLIQGTIDYFIWGKPFVEMVTYATGNFATATQYIVLPWYDYFLVVLGILVPPVSFFLFAGFIKNWKKVLLIFIPVAVFFIFHSIYPNKQERFILPIIPFIIIAGVPGWFDLVSSSRFLQSKKKIINGCWIFFWVINIVALLVISPVYSKRARVETMSYLSRYKNVQYILVADEEQRNEQFPRFYLGQWPRIYDIYKDGETTDSLFLRISSLPASEQPRFILFTGESNKPMNIQIARKYFPFIVYETVIEPGFIDKLMHWLNPINRNRKVFIYRNTHIFPNKAG